MMVLTFNPNSQESESGYLCVSEAILFYIMSSRQARAIHWNILFQKKEGKTDRQKRDKTLEIKVLRNWSYKDSV